MARRKKLDATIKHDGYRYHQEQKIQLLKNGKFQADLGMVDGKWLRRSFDTDTDAEACITAHLDALGKYGTKGLIDMTHADKLNWQAAMKQLKGYPGTLLDAVSFYCRCHKTTDGTTEIEALVSRLLAEKQAAYERGELRKATIYDARAMLKPFRLLYGQRHVGSILPADIVAMTNELPGKAKRRNVRRAVRGFYLWCKENKILDQGADIPVPKEKAGSSRGTIHIYTPEQTQNLLTHAEAIYPEYIPSMVIQLFAGVRSGEASKLRWSDINLTRNRITIRAEVSKKGYERTIGIEPNLGAWLAPFAGRTGKVSPAPTNIVRAREKIFEAAGVERKQNAFRHSYGSYFNIAYPGRFGELLTFMGHADSRVLKRHYATGKVDADEGRDYFGIMPIKEKIISIKREVA